MRQGSGMRSTSGGGASQLLKGLVVLYSGAAAAWFLLVWTPLAGWWPIQLLDLFNAWFYLPLPVLFIPFLFRRDWRSGAWLMLPIAVFGGQYGQLFLPDLRVGEGTPLRVMTANVHYLNSEVGAMVESVANERPAIVAIQELGTAMSGPLGDRLREQYPYQALYPSRNSRGMGILSRYPILEQAPPEIGQGECNCQQVTLEIDGRPVTVLNAHPDRPRMAFRRLGPAIVPTGFSTDQQEQTILRIRHKASVADTPVLILGDFNLTDRERPYRILAEVYRDAYREAGWGLGFTYPAMSRGFAAPIPLIRIDHVFHDEAFTATSARVIGLPGSDHNGVVADLALAKNR